MADVIRMQLDIQNNLQKELEKSTKKMKGFNLLLEDSASKFEGLDKKTSVINKKIDIMGEGIKKAAGSVKNGLGKAFETVGDVIDTIVPGFLTIFSLATITDAVTGVIEMDTAMTQLAFRMGHGAEGANELSQAAVDASRNLGIARDRASELVGNLTRLRVPVGMVSDMANSAGLLSELTGMSAESATELGASLVVVGGMGQRSIDNMMASMVNMQSAVGFTENEMNLLGESIMSSTQMLNTMGKEAGEIESFNSGVIELAGAFASVGVEASKATDLMNELLDPSKVEDHAFLLSQLGVSLSDAFAGELNPAELAEGFRNIGQTMQNLTGPAAAAMAEQMGMSVRDLRQLGELGDNELNAVAQAMSEGASGAEAMQAALSGRDTAAQSLQRAFETLKTNIGAIALRLMPVFEAGIEWVSENVNRISQTMNNIINSQGIEKLKERFVKILETIKGLPNIIKIGIPILIAGIFLLTKFMSRRFASVATGFAANLVTGVSEGIKQGARRGREAMFKELGEAKANVRVRVESAPAFQQLTQEAQAWQAKAEGNLISPVRRLAESTANWKNQLAQSSKPVSSLGVAVTAMSEQAKTQYEMARNTSLIRKEQLADQMRSNVAEKISLETRLSYLEKQKESGILTAREAREANKITKELEKINTQNKKNAKERATLIQSGSAAEMRALKTLGNEALRNLASEKQARVDILQSSITAKNVEIERARANRDVTAAMVSQLKKKQEAGTISSNELIKLQQLAGIEKQQTVELQKQESLRSAEKKDYNELVRENKLINQLAADRKIGLGPGAAEVAKTRGIFQNMSDYFVGKGRQFSAIVGNTGEKLKNSAVVAGQAIKERMNPRNIARSFGRGVTNGLKGLGSKITGIFRRGGRAAANEAGRANAGGGIGALLGPLALLGGILMKSEEGRELIQNTLERLREPLGKIIQVISIFVENILDALMPVIENLIDIIVPIVEDLLGDIMPIVIGLMEQLSPVIETLANLFGSLLTAMMPLIMQLVGALLPPLLKWLGLIWRLMGGLVSVLGYLPGLGFLKDVGDQMQTAGEQMAEAANGLKDQMIAQERMERERENRQRRLESERLVLEQSYTTMERDLAEQGYNITAEQIRQGDVSNELRQAVQEALDRHKQTLWDVYYAQNKEESEGAIKSFVEKVGDIRSEYGSGQAGLDAVRSFIEQQGDQVRNITGLNNEAIMDAVTVTVMDPYTMVDQEFISSQSRRMERNLGVGKDGFLRNMFLGTVNQESLSNINSGASAFADSSLERFGDDLGDFNIGVEDRLDEIADQLAGLNDINESVQGVSSSIENQGATPTVARATSAGISIENETMLPFGDSESESSPEVQTAASVAASVEEIRLQREEERQMFKTEMARREAMHEELMDGVSRILRSLPTTGISRGY